MLIVSKESHWIQTHFLKSSIITAFFFSFKRFSKNFVVCIVNFVFRYWRILFLIIGEISFLAILLLVVHVICISVAKCSAVRCKHLIQEFILKERKQKGIVSIRSKLTVINRKHLNCKLLANDCIL